jgi:threonine aldolase
MTASRKNFASDNCAGTHDAVLRMVGEANAGQLPAYGADPWTERAAEQLRGAFGTSGGIFFVFNGTAANILGLSLLVRPFEAVICAESSHLNTDECGAPERVLGSKLLQVPAPDGKLTPDLVASRLGGRGDEHRAQPRAVAIAQVTELGTCYTIGELRDLAEFCRASDLRLYLDGARLANAAAHLGCQLADLAEYVDVLSFGGTKNGAMGAEAVIVMNEKLGSEAAFQRKQQMQLASKMRYLAAQFVALLEDELWRRSAAHANAMAARLADGVRGLPGVELRHAVDANAVFAALDASHIRSLQRNWDFQVWDPGADVVRWMTAFDTTEADVDAFVTAVRAVTAAGLAPARLPAGRFT